MFARELVVSTLTQALLDLTEKQEQLNTEVSSAALLPGTNSRDLSIVNIVNRSTKAKEAKEAKVAATDIGNQEAKLEQSTQASNENPRHSLILQSSGDNSAGEVLNQDLPSTPSEIGVQNTPVVQALMHNLPPQAMVSISTYFSRHDFLV